MLEDIYVWAAYRQCTIIMVEYMKRDVVQLVERTVRDREVGGSTPPVPTNNP